VKPWLQRLAFKRRVRAIVACTSAAAVAVALSIALIGHSLSLRQSTADRLVSVLDLVGARTAEALAQASPGAAREQLGYLHTESAIQAVRVYDASGKYFAGLNFGGQPPGAGGTPVAVAADLPPMGNEAVKYEGIDAIEIQVPLMLRSHQVGTLAARAHLGLMYADLPAMAPWMAAGAALAGLVAYLLAALLESVIIAPVRDLAEQLRRALESKDFSMRVEQHTDDDVGRLVGGFSEALAELELRDRSLKAYQNEVEKRVRERTVMLNAAVAEAQEALMRAEGASRAKSDFLARMSHEIRTPMNGVLGMAELLRHSTTLDARQKRYAATIHQSGSVLLNIINDILDFSKIEAGKLELEKAPFCLRETIEDAVDIAAERALSKGLELVCDIPSNLETNVSGDGQRLRQIVINLISNAVKFTERGEVRVSVRKATQELINPRYHFEVKDTGIGIRPENCATIFESFAQEDSSTTRHYGGTGLGLAICKQLVELMGGEIGLTSAPGVGSTFFFSVPLTIDPTAEQDKRTTVLSHSGVLIVDPNVTTREVLRDHLISWGVRVTEANSAQQALEIIDRSLGGEFDVLMIEAQAPGLDANGLVTKIRLRSGFTGTPIVMLGSVEAPAAIERPGEGATVWLAKPIRRVQLRVCLLSLLARPPQALRAKEAKRPSVRPLPQSGRRISRIRQVLLVEDNPVNHEVTSVMLQELGVGVVSAWSGEEALEKLSKRRFEAILLDCQMPKLDGYATARRFREEEQGQQRSRTPIVAVTANALSGDAEKCFEAGMDFYLSKPFTIEQLYQVLEHCAPEQQSARPERDAGKAEQVASKPEQYLTNPEQGTEGGVLDQQILDRIRALHRPGGPNLLAKVVDLYSSSSRALAEALRTAVQLQDAESARQAAHALKSSSANVGALAFAELCKSVELAAAEGRISQVGEMVPSIVSEHQKVLQALEAHRLAA
jgi:signal transduction histidine kinase/DNA-binding response OmpR family regulator/HPt (histidine-containing phosphotransfer) domain-containing protein